MKTIDFPQGSEAWLQARVGHVTASRVKDVMAKGRNGEPSATRSAYIGELIAEILTGRPVNSFKGNADTERGIELEPNARLAFEIETGLSVKQVGLVLHPRMARVAASPDGLMNGNLGLELKCPRPHVHLEYMLAGVPPTAYRPQMAMQIACAELDGVMFASYCPDFPPDLQLFVTKFTPTMEYIKDMESAVAEFLEEIDAKLLQISKLRSVT